MSASLPSLRGKLAAFERWSKTPNRTQATAPARKAFLSSFEAQVDPEGKLPPRVRARMAEDARRAHFVRMNLRSVESRQRRAHRNGGGDSGDK